MLLGAAQQAHQLSLPARDASHVQLVASQQAHQLAPPARIASLVPLGVAQQSHQLATFPLAPYPLASPALSALPALSSNPTESPQSGLLIAPLAFPCCLSHRFPRIYSTVYSNHRAHRASRVLWWCRLRCYRAPHRRCTHPRRVCPRLLPCSLLFKSERSSQCALNLCKSERRSLWALNPLKAERSTPHTLNQSSKWERPSVCALNSLRQPGRSLERSPPTETRKTLTRY